MKAIPAICLTVFLLGQLHAQEPPVPGAPRPPQQGRNSQQRSEMLLQRLQLTPAQREQLKKEQEQALEKVLTPDQKKRLKEIRQQQQVRKEEMQTRQRQQLKDRLSLTDEQASQLQNLQKNFMESMKRNRQQLDQTIAQQRDRARNLMETHQQSLKKLLSTEQLEKYRNLVRDKMRNTMGPGMERLRERRHDRDEQSPMQQRRPRRERPMPGDRNTDTL